MRTINGYEKNSFNNPNQYTQDMNTTSQCSAAQWSPLHLLRFWHHSSSIPTFDYSTADNSLTIWSTYISPDTLLPQGRYTIAMGLMWHDNGLIYSYAKDH